MVDKIVVDLSKIFAAGQAYVALSRVTSLEGLQILNYKSTAIKKDKRVDTEMLRLPTKTYYICFANHPDLTRTRLYKDKPLKCERLS